MCKIRPSACHVIRVISVHIMFNFYWGITSYNHIENHVSMAKARSLSSSHSSQSRQCFRWFHLAKTMCLLSKRVTVCSMTSVWSKIKFCSSYETVASMNAWLFPDSQIIAYKHNVSDIDECNSNPCLNTGTCVDAVNGYSCSCPTAFTGGNCEQSEYILALSWKRFFSFTGGSWLI